MVNGLELMMLVCSVASSACWLHLDLSRPRALPLAPVSWGFLFTVPFDGAHGPLNAITEASGVQVGSAIPIRGEGALRAGQELGTHRSDPSPASRCERHRSGAREPGLARRQRRNDGNELGRGIGIARRGGRRHPCPQRGHGAQRDDCRGAEARHTEAALLPAGGCRDVGRLAQRHQWLPRETGRRLCGLSIRPRAGRWPRTIPAAPATDHCRRAGG